MRFFLIDRILAVEKGKAANFLKNVSHSEDYFTDHFPGSPIMPGVLILESFVQGAKLLISSSYDFSLYPELRCLRKAAFRHFVLPGDQLTISLVMAGVREQAVEIEAKAFASERLVAEATLELVWLPADVNPEVRERCQRLKQLFELLSSDPVSRAWESLARGADGS